MTSLLRNIKFFAEDLPDTVLKEFESKDVEAFAEALKLGILSFVTDGALT